MSKTFDQGKEEVARICAYFKTNHEPFHAPGVKEAEIRQTLIDPFFKALGWDVDNSALCGPAVPRSHPRTKPRCSGTTASTRTTPFASALKLAFTRKPRSAASRSAPTRFPAYQLRALRLERETGTLHSDRL